MLLLSADKIKLHFWHSLRSMTIAGERVSKSMLEHIITLGLPNMKILHGYGMSIVADPSFQSTKNFKQVTNTA